MTVTRYHGNQVKKIEKKSNKIGYFQFTIKIDLKKIKKIITNPNGNTKKFIINVDSKYGL